MEGQEEGSAGNPAEQVSGEASPESGDQGAQTGAQVEAQEGAQEQAKAVDWSTQPLPDGHPSGEKYKTLGDLNKAYEASSAEGRRLYHENLRLQGLLRQPRPVEGKPAEPKPYFGYGSKEAWTQAINSDFDGTMRRVIADGAKPLVQEEVRGLREQFRMIQDKMQEETRAAHYHRLVSKYPDAAAGSPGNDAAGTFAERNPWVGRFMEEHPEVDPFDVVYKLGNFDVLSAKLADAEKKLAEYGKRAQSARAGTGAPKNVKQGSGPVDAVNAAAEDMRNAGEPVSEAVLESARKAALKHLNFG